MTIDQAQVHRPIWRLRAGTAADLPALAAVYTASARAIAPARYDAAQVEAWSAFGEDLPAFEAWLAGSDLLLACGDDLRPIGFCAIAADGHVHALYLAAPHNGRGLGLRLLNSAMDQARVRGIQRFHAEATHFSRGVFERAGFHLVEREESVHRGVRFERFRMST